MVKYSGKRIGMGVEYIIIAVSLSVVLVVKTGKAEEMRELVTDRPDQTESSVVILPGYIQVETGTTYTEEDEDEDGKGTQTFDVPGTLFRIGLYDRLELRIGLDGWIREDVNEKSGFGDSEVGIKIYLREEDGWQPETALLTGLSLPTGKDGISSKRADPSFRFLFSHRLSEMISLGYNIGAVWDTEEDRDGDRDTLSLFQYTLTTGIGLTNRLGAYVELYGDVPINANGGPAHSFDTGFTYLIHQNLQIDISGGIGLSTDADDWFVGAGISYRFPQ